jgi:predicted N-acetyltransferase YhbS
MSSTLEIAPHSRPLVELPPRLPGRLRFLGPEATPKRLIRATAANHLSWFTAGALASGGEIRKENGTIWLATSEELTLVFPRMPSVTASATLDTFLADCRRRMPVQAACWAVPPTQPRDLGVRLAARGFEWGWQPHWMALELREMRADFPLPEGLKIAVDDESDWDVEDLPYYNQASAAVLRAHARTQPRRTWHFGAWLEGKIVGHSLIHLTTGALGVAGIYSVGVTPSARNRGVGRAVTLAACQFAQALGCHYATLNSATPIYDRLGFVSLGRGQTWWMHAPTLAAPPPTPEQIAFAEAIGRGDVKALEALDRRALPENLDAPLPCGMTPMTLAAKTRKPTAAEWLIAHGTTLEIIHAWDLGWKDRASEMLARSPERVNRGVGPSQLTPLHEAAARNDVELARLLLTAHPDLKICDSQYNGTPLGWAYHFQHAEIVALIEAYRDARVI